MTRDAGLANIAEAPSIGVRAIRQGEPVTILFTEAAPITRRPSGLIGRPVSRTLFGPTVLEVARALCEDLQASATELKAFDDQPRAVGVSRSGGLALAHACSVHLTAASLNQAFRTLATQ